jgi:hypothetical protein
LIWRCHHREHLTTPSCHFLVRTEREKVYIGGTYVCPNPLQAAGFPDPQPAGTRGLRRNQLLFGTFYKFLSLASLQLVWTYAFATLLAIDLRVQIRDPGKGKLK